MHQINYIHKSKISIKMKDNEINKEQLLIRLSENTKNCIRDIANDRKKAKKANNTLADVANELINEGLKTITK